MPAKGQAGPTRSPFLIFVVCGLVVVGAVMGRWRGYWRLDWLVGYLLGVNLATFCLYGYDKAAAGREGRLRVPERVLHLFALVGGTPMAFVGQRAFHHKTVKRSFRIVFWTVFALQVAVIGACIYFVYFGNK